MKAITLWQPWATLVAYGVKSIETRSWGTKHRGELAIHAAAGKPRWDKMSTEALRLYRQWAKFNGLEDDAGSAAVNKHIIPRGAVVAICTLSDCQEMTESSVAAQLASNDKENTAFGIWEPGRFAWALRNIRKLDKPIAARGHQTMWTWEPPALAEMLRDTFAGEF
jgi:activating signal cointegrator 1